MIPQARCCNKEKHRAPWEPLVVQEQWDPTLKSVKGREKEEHLLHKPCPPLQGPHQNPRSHPEPSLTLHFHVDANCCLFNFLNIFHIHSLISIPNVTILSQALVLSFLNYSKSLCWFTYLLIFPSILFFALRLLRFKFFIVLFKPINKSLPTREVLTPHFPFNCINTQSYSTHDTFMHKLIY